ncbi:hypothetical protein KJ903_02880, partial [Patescibacteria group bacterium]|nr:hypothetical protein [Patescibacteria group bacterium]
QGIQVEVERSFGQAMARPLDEPGRIGVCSHAGGDYWWRIPVSDQSDIYFCDIIPSCVDEKSGFPKHPVKANAKEIRNFRHNLLLWLLQRRVCGKFNGYRYLSL